MTRRRSSGARHELAVLSARPAPGDQGDARLADAAGPPAASARQANPRGSAQARARGADRARGPWLTLLQARSGDGPGARGWGVGRPGRAGGTDDLDDAAPAGSHGRAAAAGVAAARLLPAGAAPAYEPPRLNLTRWARWCDDRRTWHRPVGSDPPTRPGTWPALGDLLSPDRGRRPARSPRAAEDGLARSVPEQGRERGPVLTSKPGPPTGRASPPRRGTRRSARRGTTRAGQTPCGCGRERRSLPGSASSAAAATSSRSVRTGPAAR